jgi:hypothetical protein
MQRRAVNISNETAMPIGEREKRLIDAFPEAILDTRYKVFKLTRSGSLAEYSFHCSPAC